MPWVPRRYGKDINSKQWLLLGGMMGVLVAIFFYSWYADLQSDRREVFTVVMWIAAAIVLFVFLQFCWRFFRKT